MKTTSFDIHARHDNIRGEDNTYKEVFIGYEVRHDLSLSFPKDMAKLDEVISVLSMCLADHGVRIGFVLSDIDGPFWKKQRKMPWKKPIYYAMQPM